MMKTKKIMKKIFIVNCDKLQSFETFQSLERLFDYLHELNKTRFEGTTFSYFGRGAEMDMDGNWVSSPYYIDSVVLCPKNKPNEYYTFFIRCIDENGNSIELD